MKNEKGSHEQAVEVFAAIHRQALGNPKELSNEETSLDLIFVLMRGIDALSELAGICNGKSVHTINKIKNAFPEDMSVTCLMDAFLVFLIDANGQLNDLESIGHALNILAEGVEQPETSQS